MRQWPDNIVSGRIRYHHASNYHGFALSDAQHGIPTFGAVSESGAHVFNYPGQTEDIARRLVACWNYCVGLSTEELERLSAEKESV